MRRAVLLVLVVAACGSRPSTDAIIAAAHEHLEHKVGAYNMMVVGHVKFESAKVVEVRDYCEPPRWPETIGGWPARVEIAYQSDDTPGAVFVERTKTMDFLIVTDHTVDHLPDDERADLRKHAFGKLGWHAWQCDFEAERCCHPHMVP